MAGVFSISALALTGCSDDSDSSSTDTGTTESADTEETTETTDETEEAEKTEEAKAEKAEKAEEAKEADNAAAAGDTPTVESVYDKYDTYYMGITDDDKAQILLAFGNNGESGMLESFEIEKKDNDSWTGAVETDGDMMTISDEENGTSFTFECNEIDGGYQIDMGEYGTALIEETDRDSFVEAAENVDKLILPQF